MGALLSPILLEILNEYIFYPVFNGRRIDTLAAIRGGERELGSKSHLYELI